MKQREMHQHAVAGKSKQQLATWPKHNHHTFTMHFMNIHIELFSTPQHLWFFRNVHPGDSKLSIAYE